MRDTSRPWHFVLLFVIATVWATHHGSANQGQPKKMTWNYSATTIQFFGKEEAEVTKKLQELADNGWELVSMVPATRAGSTQSVLVVCRQPKD